MYYIWAIWVLNSFLQLASDTDHFIHVQRDIRLFDAMDDNDDWDFRSKCTVALTKGVRWPQTLSDNYSLVGDPYRPSLSSVAGSIFSRFLMIFQR